MKWLKRIFGLDWYGERQEMLEERATYDKELITNAKNKRFVNSFNYNILSKFCRQCGKSLSYKFLKYEYDTLTGVGTLVYTKECTLCNNVIED